jgi:cytochrome c oxidase assembly protein subunit 15
MSVTKNDRQIARWLISGILLVALMLILGSITRLTNSGLSMVTWKPITGTIPPLNEIQWQEEFTKYQTSPEYIKLNYHFDLAQFKEIFFWEYSHRLLGRIIGLVFFIPFVYFILKKKIKSKKLLGHLLVIFFLGGMQGVIGWFMVKSGLRDNPHVSHLWLATHLVTALFLISYIFVTVLHLLFPNHRFQTLETKKVYLLSKILLMVASLQIIYGAFVAGLKAGKLHATYPKMGKEWFPKMISENFNSNGILSFFEDSYLIMFTHRWLAVIVLFLVFYIIYIARKMILTIHQKRTLKYLLIAISIQFLLGVFTILYGVPVSLGVLHQFGAMLLLLSVLAVIYFFKKDKSIDDKIV